MIQRNTTRVAALTLLLAACASSPRPPQSSALERRTRLVDTASGTELELDAVVARLARAEAVFFGESHVDETTHALELAVYAGVIEARGGKVVLALEMFARDAQPVLDAYLAGKIDEPEFLARSEPWGNYRTGYRPLVELAKARGLPVVGSNVPAGLRRKVSQGEAEAFAALTEEERRYIAPELLPNSEAYWERFVRIVRGHAGQTTAPADYLYSGQSLWDNTMGFSCAEALAARPGWLVFHVNGGFHTGFGLGTAEQLRLRRPGTRIATIAATAVEDTAGLEFEGVAPEADILAFVEARGRDLQDGYHAVRTGHTQRFRLHVPEGASEARPAPLLIWLTRDGVSAEDEYQFWKVALGDEAAVAVLEPTYRALAEDLGPAGTWIHVETTSEDVSAALAAVRDTRRYVERYYPVDPARVLVAGAGTGGAVAAAGALAGEFESAAAFEPAAYRRLRTWGLPEPGGPTRRLLVAAGEEAEAWWGKELEDYGPSGVQGEFSSGADDEELVVRRRLAILGPVTKGASIDLSVPQRSRLWAATEVRARDRGLQVADLADLPEGLLSGRISGRVLPVPEGPFGGTTVLIVPTSEADAWRALEDSQVMSAHGGLFQLRVAVAGGSPSPREVLSELHRKNVLIVPATSCASENQMRELRDEVRPELEHMTYAFLPGLGGRLHLAAGN